jgi:hypothetical protein
MDPLLKLVVDIQNSEKVKELTTYVNQQDQAIRQLNADLRNGVVTQQQFAAAALPLAGNIRNANNQLRDLQAASGGAGLGLGQLAYAIDDIQYGFNAIVNNIPAIALGLGAGAGVAGAAGIAAVAVNQLIKHWGDLTDAFAAAMSDEPIEWLKEMRLKAEEAAEAFEMLKEAQTGEQHAEQSAVKDILIRNPGIRARAADLAEQVANDPRLGAPKRTARDNRRTQSDLPEIGGGPGTSNQADLDRAKAEADLKTAERLLGQAVSKDPTRRADAIAEIKRLDPDLGKQLEEQSPEAQKDQKDFEKKLSVREQIERRIKSETEAKDREAEAASKRNADIEEANRAKAKKDRHEALEEEKRKRIEKLEDQRDAIMKNPPRQAQILGDGARSAVDYYQKAAGMDARKVKLLEKIAEELKKERRMVLPK